MRTFTSHQLNYIDSSRHIPSSVLTQKEIIFRNIRDIVSLHERTILPALTKCVTDDDVAMLLIKHSEDFEKYLQYIAGQAQAETCLTDKAIQQYFKELPVSKHGEAPVMDVITFLQRPVERIHTYQALLKELIKNKAKSGQSCCMLEDAFSSVSCLPWRSNNLHQVSLIENYPAPLTALGEPLRQGAITVWEETPEVKSTTRGHQRQVFLFRECIVLCKVKKDTSLNTDTYIFKNKMKLNDVEIKETVGGDDRSWGLWHEHRGSMRKYTLQCRSSLIKLSWLKDLKELQQLADCMTKIGQTIKLSCKVTGCPKPDISWLKGLSLEDDPHHIVTADRTGICSLILDSLTPEDSGQYICYATNSLGSAGSLAKVVVQPPRFVSRLENICLIEGEDISFTCSTLSLPLPRVWLKNGSELNDQQKYLILNDARSGILSLTIVSATETDIGQYECELTNEFGCVKCKAGLCPAYVPPADIPPCVQVPIEDLSVEPGQTATFTAIITGRPGPSIKWYKDEDELLANDNVEIVQHGARCSLTVMCPEGEDSGLYTCFAYNESGQVLCQAQLTVVESQEREVELGKRRKLFSVYDVHEEIGGTFSVVKRVIHRRTGEVFAAKFLPLKNSTRTRAFQERDLLSRLAHPRVACLLDFFCTRRTLVLITECCSHGLMDHLYMRGSVTEKEVQSYIQQILEGIGHIHSMNILHLDIKPENILMVYPPRDEIKICDFGFCQEIDTSRHLYSMHGTPEFVAPEIVHQEPVSVATDIALGVIAFLLVCRCPFIGESDRATLLRVGEGTLNWDAPDVLLRSSEAQHFLHMVLQPDPQRPSAFECLSHEWFQDDHAGEDTDEINTRTLKVFLSKRKWQGSLTESLIMEHGSDSSSRLGSFEDLRHFQTRSAVSEGYDDQAEPLVSSSAGSFQELDRVVKPKAPPRNRSRSNQSLNSTSQPSPSPSLSSLQAPDRPPRAKDKKDSHALQRHASAPALEVQPSPGRSPKLGFFKIFRRQSWTGHSYSQLDEPGLGPTLGEIMKPDTPTMSLRKKMRASASSLTKLFSRSKEDVSKGPEVVRLDRGGVLVVWKPVQSSDTFTYCVQCCSDGVWTVLTDEETDCCYTVTDLPRGASYVFRVGCVTKAGAGPFSEVSVPIVMSTHPEGRFSVLTVCRDVETSQVFAAKITPYKPEQRLLVLREYQLLRRLNHYNLVPLHMAFLTPTYMVLVEELCPGKELLYSLAADLYAESHVAELLVQILSAVDYLHGRRVIHLDLKSDNMLVDDCDHLKIVDFGSALSFTPGQPVHVEHVHGVSESKYIVLPKAPEILEGQGVGPETDIWAIGVLSFILSADTPFYAELGWEQDRNIKKGKIQFGHCYPGLSEGALNFMKSTLNHKSARPTAAECLQNPWLRAHRGILKGRHRQKVCFSTDKLKSYLSQKEEKREEVRTKLQ
uniref:Uncharacterized protein n=1 Tax=Periophthalmus magnuspinnatus TaxID=409849 RepID=A0A3B4AEV8_9GOBI